MKTQEEIVAQLRALHTDLAERYGLEGLALFGSVARNQHKPDSDVDLLVTFVKSPGLAFFDLEAELTQKLGIKVDLIPRSGIKPHYWERIAPEVVEVVPFA